MGAQNPFIQSGSESPLFWRAGAGVGAGASDQPAPQAPLCTGGGAAARDTFAAAGRQELCSHAHPARHAASADHSEVHSETSNRWQKRIGTSIRPAPDLRESEAQT